MAGDWIKMRIDLYEDPAVIEMADRMDEREEHIVGYCHKIWSWVSRQCGDGTATGVALVSLGRVVNLPGFPELMCDVGWLEYDDSGERPVIKIPKFERHLSQSAKQRAVKTKNKQSERSRVADVSPSKGDIDATREEKRREEVKTTSLPVRKAENRSSQEYPEWFESVWSASPSRDGRRVGKAKAFDQARGLSEEDQSKLLIATKAYTKHCREADRLPQDLWRWIRDSLWRDFVPEAKAKSQTESAYVDPAVKRNMEIAGFIDSARRIGKGQEWLEEHIYERDKRGDSIEEIRAGCKAALQGD